MATTPVEFKVQPGIVPTLKLYAYGSDTLANTGGDVGTEKTNNKGLYSASVTEALLGWYDAQIVDSGGATIANFSVYLRDTTAIHRCEDAPAKMYDGASEPQVDPIKWLGTALATPTVAGVPEVDLTHVNGTANPSAAGRPEVIAAQVGATPSGNVNIQHSGGYLKVSEGTSTGQLDLTSGRPGIDWAKVSNPTTTLGLSGTTVKAVTDRVTANTDQIAGSGPAATNQSKAALAVARGVVTTGASTTSIPTTSITPAAGVTDQFKDRVVIFDSDTTTANLRGVAAVISASTSGGTLTVSTLPATPANTDAFGIY